MKKVPQKYIDNPISSPYTPVLSFEGKEFVITSGQCCDDCAAFDGNIPNDIKAQTRMTIEACIERLAEAGATLDDVVFVEVNLSDINEWGQFNEVYREMIPDPKPCRKATQVVLLPEYKVELVMFAAK